MTRRDAAHFHRSGLQCIEKAGTFRRDWRAEDGLLQLWPCERSIGLAGNGKGEMERRQCVQTDVGFFTASARENQRCRRTLFGCGIEISDRISYVEGCIALGRSAL